VFDLILDTDMFKLLNKIGDFETAVAFVVADDHFGLENLETIAFRSGFGS
jgi:hypothetical protein